MPPPSLIGIRSDQQGREPGSGDLYGHRPQGSGEPGDETAQGQIDRPWDWLPDFGAWSPETWAALGAVLTPVIGIAAAIFAFRQVREARRLREQQAQPYVAVYREKSRVSHHLYDLVVKNFGTTVAFNVRMQSKPALRRTRPPQHQEITLPIIPTLVPGQEWRTFWESAIDWRDSGLPDVYEILVKYETDVGGGGIFRRNKRTVELSYRIDWSESRGTLSVTEYSIHDAATALREIRDLIKSIKRSPGLSVVVRDAEDVDSARRKATEEALAAHEEITRRVSPVRGNGETEADESAEQEGGTGDQPDSESHQPNKQEPGQER